VPVLGIVENMSFFLCPHCGERSDIFSHGGAHREADKLGAEFLGEVPLHMTIRETSDEGRPVVVSHPEGEHAAIYRRMAARIWEKLSGTPQRAAPRIVVQ
jgi:ATP-binding protein involved in chromosome partitioning